MIIDDKIKKEVITELCGEEALPVVDFLIGKENVSEFIIVDALQMSINELRNILYKLEKLGLISFKRKKDKKKGWYVYYWTLQSQLIYFLYEKMKKEKLKRLESRLEREKNNTFYTCKNHCIRLDFDQAMSFNFTCPECGELLNETNNTEIINNIKKEIDKTKRELDDFHKKLEVIRKKNILLNQEKRNEENKEKAQKKRGRRKKEKKVDEKKDEERERGKENTEKGKNKKTKKKTLDSKSRKANKTKKKSKEDKKNKGKIKKKTESKQRGENKKKTSHTNKKQKK